MATQTSTLKDEAILKALRTIPVAPIIDELNKLGYHWMNMQKVRSQTPGRKLVGRAVTLRFLPPRPDVQAEVGNGTQTAADYRAYELCGPGTVLVIDGMGQAEEAGVVGGDVKFHRLKRRGAEGIVTDGAFRDIVELRRYDIALFSSYTTLAAGPTIPFGYGINEVIQCGGVLVKPGDYIVGEDEGIVLGREGDNAIQRRLDIEAHVSQPPSPRPTSAPVLRPA